MKNFTLLIFLSILSNLLFAEENINSQIIEISVTEKGFEPSSIKVASGKSVTLKIIRKTDQTCSTLIQIPTLKIKKDLPLNQTITISLGHLEKGEIRFGCGMTMMNGGKIFIY